MAADFRMEVTLSPGTYYLEVKGGDSNTVGSYKLHIDGQGAATTEAVARITILTGSTISDRIYGTFILSYLQKTLRHDSKSKGNSYCCIDKTKQICVVTEIMNLAIFLFCCWSCWNN